MNNPPANPNPQTEFRWSLYADATFAGLSVLIPIPGLDWLLEQFFARRIPGAVARYRSFPLSPEVRQELIRSKKSWWASCLLLPIVLTFGLLKRLSKKILYFLTVKEATDQVSYYWHVAFLIDYAMRQGQLDTLTEAEITRQAIDETVDGFNTSPILQLAGRVIGDVNHLFRTLRDALRGQEDDVIEAIRARMRAHWPDFVDYFTALANRYDQVYQDVASRPIASDTDPTT